MRIGHIGPECTTDPEIMINVYISASIVEWFMLHETVDFKICIRAFRWPEWSHTRPQPRNRSERWSMTGAGSYKHYSWQRLVLIDMLYILAKGGPQYALMPNLGNPWLDVARRSG